MAAVKGAKEDFREPPSPSGFPTRELVNDVAPDSELLWELLAEEAPRDIESIQRNIVNHCHYTLSRTRFNMDNFGLYQATALSIRDRLLESWNPTQQYFTEKQVKRVYYLSLEFLLGRSLQNAVLNLALDGLYGKAMRQLGVKLEELYDEEKDAALGNGGLGRLAACFMDSLASMNYPAWGYGLRYRYGMFAQKIINGRQVEFPDYWLGYGNPWEIPRLDVTYPVRFYGTCTQHGDKFTWDGGELVQAVAYDVPVPGYHTENTINLRLWAAKPSKEFDLESFNRGDYFAAIDAKRRSEDISAVLYPNDNTLMGKELRLKQQYFFVCATLQDVIRRFRKAKMPWERFPDKVAIQLNDTHPSIGIAELMRILVDEEHLDWEPAWEITTKTYAFTNHTVLPEALERWPVGLMENLLPRHMRIIYDINYRFLQQVEKRNPGDLDLLSRMSIIEESPRQVRMAHLAIVGSHAVNGVAALHTYLLKTGIFADFCKFYGEDKFQNKTNGITPRRWLNQANRPLATLLTTWLGSGDWLMNLDQLRGLAEHVGNPDLQREWAAMKKQSKERLADYVERTLKIKISTDALFDVQVKRIHEYKRQLLNILSVIYRYDLIKKMSHDELKTVVPRVVFFGGKAAPGYIMAKRIIRLITAVAEVVNNDPEIGDLLKIVFIPNYNVSVAETIIPASDISQHISTAGMEASGTSNMKFALNGGLIIGTMDGANIEIAQEIGEENMFIFGALAKDVDRLRHEVRFRPPEVDPRLARVYELINSGTFTHDDSFPPILDSIQHGNDYYLLSVDFPSYIDAQTRVDETYRDKKQWTRMSIMSTAGMGFFSSDRTIRQYAEEIWNIKPCARKSTSKGRATPKRGERVERSRSPESP